MDERAGEGAASARWGLRGRYARRWALACVALFGLARCTSEGDCCCCDGGVFMYETLLPDHEEVEGAAVRYAMTSAAVAAAVGGTPTSVTLDEDALGAPEVVLRRAYDGRTIYTAALTAVGPTGTVALTVYLHEAADGRWSVVGAEVSGVSEGEVPALEAHGGGGSDWD